MDKYGVAFSVNNDFKRDSSVSPQVITVESEDKAISMAENMKGYLYNVTPFENFSERRDVGWSYIESHTIKF